MDSLFAFHFLRPYWLFALVPLAWLFYTTVRSTNDAGGWKNIVDAALLSHVLTRRHDRRSPTRWLLAAGWLLGVIALAGPTWSQSPVAAERTQGARVFLIDLSRSMNATDLPPSRLARAKLKLLDMLERSRGAHVALIAYAENPYVVAPLTHDARTVANLVPALATDVVPLQGNRPDRALLKAADLIRQSGLSHGDIMLITDDAGDPMLTRDIVRRLAQQRFRVSVYGVGTAEGGPIALADGKVVKDKTGHTAMPRLDAEALRELAALGGGTYATMTPDDSDIAALLRQARTRGAAGRSAEEQNIGQWDDYGIYFVIALLPFAALGLRRGWLASFALVLVAQPGDAFALHWDELWSRSDQTGAAMLEAGDAQAAAERFEDPLWRGVALVRAQRYEEAAAEFAKVQTAEGHYNRGNALAYLQKWREALDAYNAALALDPNHDDAQFNRNIVAKQLAAQNNASSDASNAAAPTQDAGSGKNSSDQAASQRAGTSDNRGGQATNAQDSGAGDERQTGTGARDQATQAHSSAESSQADRQGAGAQAQSSASGSGGKDNARERDGEQEGSGTGADDAAATREGEDAQAREAREAREQWLRRVPDDPGGLLRRKFQRDQQRLQAEGEPDSSGAEKERAPW